MKMSNAPVIAVIGAGASGLMAALSAANEASVINKKIRIVMFDGNSRVGKKLLVTGNGRCNLTNLNMDTSFFYGSQRLFNEVCRQFDNYALIDFFASIGLAVKSDLAGRVYPLSNQASSVLDALRFEMQKRDIEFVPENKITSIKRSGGGFLLNGSFFADKCILACGGCAGFVHGSDGSGYELLRELGIGVTEVFPALNALEIAGFTKSLKGIRAEGEISVKNAGKLLSSKRGELQYADYGISGIPAMQVSRFAAGILNGGAPFVSVYIDSVPSMSREQLTVFIEKTIKNNPALPCEMLLAGLMPKKLGAYLLSDISINPSKCVSVLNKAVISKIADSVKSKKYKVTGVKGFADAQVTAGGVPEYELIPGTLETKKIKGLYVCGELADVDGDCGGYNLQWAFSSGHVAGMNAVRGI